MAEGNNKSNTLPGSGQKVERLCMPCKDKKVPANRLCIECEAYFCEQCSQHFHATIPNLAKHVILKDDEIDVWGQLHYKCDTHNQMFTFFCKGHDTLCCMVCSHLEHSACKEKEFIQTAAEGICNSQGLVQLKAETKGIQEKISEWTNKFHLKTKANLESKQKCIDSVKQHRQTVNALFDTLDQNALKQMEANFDSNKTYISESLNRLTRFDNEAKLLNRQVNSAREDKNWLVYICLKSGNELVKNIKQNVNVMDSTTAKDNFEINIDKKIKYFVETRKETGRIEDDHSRSSDEYGAKLEVTTQDKGDLICQLEEKMKCLQKDVTKVQTQIKEKDCNIKTLENKVRDFSRRNDHLKKAKEDLERRVRSLENDIKTQKEHTLKTEETCKALVHGNDLGALLPTLCEELSVLNGSKLRDLFKDIKDEVAQLSIRKRTVQFYGTDKLKSEKEAAMAVLTSRFSAVGMVLDNEEIKDTKCIDPDVPLLIICKNSILNIRDTLEGVSFSQHTIIALLSPGLNPESQSYSNKNIVNALETGMVHIVHIKGSFSSGNDEGVDKIVKFIQTFGKRLPVEKTCVGVEDANKVGAEAVECPVPSLMRPLPHLLPNLQEPDFPDLIFE